MCGRYLSFADSEIIAAQNMLQFPSRSAFPLAQTEVFPSQTAPILIIGGNSVVCTPGRWGFSRWEGKGVLINARSETAHTTRVFAPYYTSCRCLIPAHGYFEWKKSGKTSERYLFTGDGESGLFLAGLFRMEHDTAFAYVILTRPAQPGCDEIHDRMPLIVPYDQINNWLYARIDALALSDLTFPLTISPD